MTDKEGSDLFRGFVTFFHVRMFMCPREMRGNFPLFITTLLGILLLRPFLLLSG